MMTCKFVGVFVTVTLRGAPLLEPPDHRINSNILDVVLGDEHQGKICGSVTCLYKGAGLRVFVKVNLDLDFLVLMRIYVTREQILKREKTVDVDQMV